MTCSSEEMGVAANAREGRRDWELTNLPTDMVMRRKRFWARPSWNVEVMLQEVCNCAIGGDGSIVQEGDVVFIVAPPIRWGAIEKIMEFAGCMWTNRQFGVVIGGIGEAIPFYAHQVVSTKYGLAKRAVTMIQRRFRAKAGAGDSRWQKALKARARSRLVVVEFGVIGDYVDLYHVTRETCHRQPDAVIMVQGHMSRPHSRWLYFRPGGRRLLRAVSCNPGNVACLAFSTLLPPLEPDMIAEAMVSLLGTQLKYAPLDEGTSTCAVKLAGPASLKLYVVGSSALTWSEQGVAFDTVKIAAMIGNPSLRRKPLVVDWHREGWRIDSPEAVNYTVFPDSSDSERCRPWDPIGKGTMLRIITLIDDTTHDGWGDAITEGNPDPDQ